MKKLILIFLLIFSMILSACSAGNGNSESLCSDNAETPSPTYKFELFVDVFKSDNSIRDLFKVIAEESLSITEGKTFQFYFYDYYGDGRNTFLGFSDEGQTDGEQFALSNSAKEAIDLLRNRFPEMVIWMHGINEEHTDSIGVFFSGIYPNGIDDGEFDRLELFFTKGDMTDMVSKYGYEDLSGGWYAYTYIPPCSTNEPQSPKV